tara:strand:- start:8 stop:235 length:228 start_codon:yes stop_codon:yes gene_type:complete
MTNSESFALNQWLCDYPDDMSYADIIERLSVENEWNVDDITVWQLVENNTTDQVAEFIEDTKAAYERSLTFGEQQ